MRQTNRRHMLKFKDGYVETQTIIPGSKIKFHGDKNRFTVRASNKFVAVCTKGPFYTIVIWAEMLRGAENRVFGLGAETTSQCEKMLERVTKGSSEISHRRNEYVEIDEIRVMYKDHDTKRDSFHTLYKLQTKHK